MTHNFKQASLDQWNFSIESTLKIDKFSVFLVKGNVDGDNYILKTFPKNQESQQAYIREQKLHSSLSHPNIIKYVSESRSLAKLSRSSAILMEYAPYGDFFNLAVKCSFNNEKLVRTYFHQLIDGIQYLHSKGIAHLDLKLENLLLGSDCKLKIADFDLAQDIKEKRCISRGTENYRALEVWANSCSDYCEADVYSAGICLFSLLTSAYPFTEEADGEEGQLKRYDLYMTDNEKFWEQNEKFFNESKTFSKSLKDLLNKMWKEDPTKRISLEQIKQSRWYNESVYSDDDLKLEVQKLLIH